MDDSHVHGSAAATACPGGSRHAVADPAIKARVREVGEETVARGAFGAPWIVVDGKPFWGWDRLPMVESRLQTGV